ncbi:hypothetical protein K443DRAFT_341056 [Laccaria amethystina LaAM-08-1]|uniref:Uncharacterized protein n=1 Tax=Laccaria amethystina LaAM-08-1 TaxID=1095629 RepID=A0A0C9XFQ5_9AGAR|nr:hypothetical protein K443DRAFT_341056 [Laccaria amethystina LaAM-08-1]
MESSAGKLGQDSSLTLSADLFLVPRTGCLKSTVLTSLCSIARGVHEVFPLKNQIWALSITSWVLLHDSTSGASNPKRLPLPPGPKGYPVIGNLFALSTDKIWLLYDKWFQLYGWKQDGHSR